tara:strand:+ start:293 stop:1222 length:930 start_codon:yes stop_codon:yes gene_type:complete
VSEQYAIVANKLLFRYGKSFHWARYFLGRETGLEATRLYAFCRYLDDIADNNENDNITKLKSIEDVINNNPNEAENSPEVYDFLQLAEELNLPIFAVKDLLSGLISDQNNVLILDKDQLLQYAYKVAGTVGLLMTPILRTSSKRALPFAIDLGIAMQLTNIARDVLEDAQLDRRYIPGSWCDNVSAKQIVAFSKAGTPNERWLVAKAIERVLSLAEIYYRSGFKGLAYLPVRHHLAILIAGIIYRLIGRRLLNGGTKWWKERQAVSKTGKALHSLYSPLLLLSRLKPLPLHHSQLHACLKDYLNVDEHN